MCTCQLVPFAGRWLILRPNKKNVFQLTGLKILGRVGMHIFYFNYFYSGKIYNFMHFEKHFAFQNA